MKKFLITFLLFMFLAPLGINISNANMTDNKAAILNYSLLNDSQAKDTFWKPLDCEDSKIKPFIEQYTTDKKSFDKSMEGFKESDPGFVKDVKGCVLERTINGIIKWIVYLMLIWFIFWAVIIVGTEMLGWDKWGSDPMGWMGGWFWEQGWGSQNKILEKLKTPLWGIAILVLLTLWVLNIFIKIIQFIFDSVV